MAQLIKILSDHVIDKIAAGEVVERPSSVVKELVENSIDAGARDIRVEIEQAGKRLIRIEDDGCGMSRDDARLAFERHATSKITSDTDLEAVRTMGFRGEALSSIASVARVRMLTAEKSAPAGTLVEIEGGTLNNIADAGAPQGTSIDISHLFYNTPARQKFLKSPATEFSHIVSALSRQAMAHPAIRFRLSHNQKQVLDLPASQSTKERAFQLFGADLADHLMEFSGGRDSIRVHGLLGRPGYSRADKTYQDFYVNGRTIRNSSLSHALYAAYSDMLMRDRHPAAFVFIEIDPSLVDVNVHPAKAEVRFRNQSQLHDLVRDVIREGLRGQPGDYHSSDIDNDLSGAKEAFSDYAASSEFGVRSSEYKSLLPNEGSTREQPLSFGIFSGSSDIHSEPATMNSELLFPLAQVHDSFIVAQSAEEMVLVDQHAAHERVLFEKLQDRFGNGRMQIQDLLIPVQLELGPSQAALLNELIDALSRAGLLIEDFGNGSFIIKAVPSLLTGADYKRLLHDILDEVTAHGGSKKIESLRDDVLSVMACHPAIKINRKLSQQEMEGLLADLFSCRMPHTCPHGRPTIIRFTMHEIRKMFKRE